MKKFLCLMILCTVSICMLAIPAKRVPFTVMLENGEKVQVVMVGDENCHYLATVADGTPVVMESEGVYRLAPEIKDQLHDRWKERMTKRNNARLSKQTANKNLRKAFGSSSSFIGKKKGIVILANYSDQSMKTSSTLNAFKNQFNQEGYNKNNHIGSVHDYFYDQSYGKFDLEFDVYGPVKLSKSIKYYGKNDEDGNDMYTAEMVSEVCKLADAAYSINWKDYDWDGDGEVDQVFIIYAGYGEHAGAPSYTIWPHEFSLTECEECGDGNGPISFGGTKVDVYAMTCELTGTSGSTIGSIGTACHEFSHCLGLMDTYDIYYEGGFGMDSWDVMCGGSYNGPTGYGEVPAGFSAYERQVAGWLELKELNSACTVTTMPSLGDEPVAYVLYNDGNRNEGFILENRQPKDWFMYTSEYTGMHGLLISHIDYDKDVWKKNEINTDPKHQRMTIIPAGKKYGTLVSGQYSVSESQYASQLFPGSNGVTELTNTSHSLYGGKLFNKNTDGSYYMNKPITDICENSDGTISFKLMGGGSVIDDIPEITVNDGKEEWFTLDGMRVDSPTKQGVYIVKKNGKSMKVIF